MCASAIGLNVSCSLCLVFMCVLSCWGAFICGFKMPHTIFCFIRLHHRKVLYELHYCNKHTLREYYFKALQWVVTSLIRSYNDIQNYELHYILSWLFLLSQKDRSDGWLEMVRFCVLCFCLSTPLFISTKTLLMTPCNWMHSNVPQSGASG